MKTCNTCKQEKPFDQYGRDKQRPDGRLNMCRTCRNSALRSSYNGPTDKKRAKDKRLYGQRPREKVKSDSAYLRDYNQVQQAELTDTYIKKLLTKNTSGVLAYGDIPATLVELKRAEILIHKIIRDKSND